MKLDKKMVRLTFDCNSAQPEYCCCDLREAMAGCPCAYCDNLRSDEEAYAEEVKEAKAKKRKAVR